MNHLLYLDSIQQFGLDSKGLVASAAEFSVILIFMVNALYFSSRFLAVETIKKDFLYFSSNKEKTSLKLPLNNVNFFKILPFVVFLNREKHAVVQRHHRHIGRLILGKTGCSHRLGASDFTSYNMKLFKLIVCS